MFSHLPLRPVSSSLLPCISALADPSPNDRQLWRSLFPPSAPTFSEPSVFSWLSSRQSDSSGCTGSGQLFSRPSSFSRLVPLPHRCSSAVLYKQCEDQHRSRSSRFCRRSGFHHPLRRSSFHRSQQVREPLRLKHHYSRRSSGHHGQRHLQYLDLGADWDYGPAVLDRRIVRGGSRRSFLVPAERRADFAFALAIGLLSHVHFNLLFGAEA